MKFDCFRNVFSGFLHRSRSLLLDFLTKQSHMILNLTLSSSTRRSPFSLSSSFQLHGSGTKRNESGWIFSLIRSVNSVLGSNSTYMFVRLNNGHPLLLSARCHQSIIIINLSCVDCCNHHRSYRPFVLTRFVSTGTSLKPSTHSSFWIKHSSINESISQSFSQPVNHALSSSVVTAVVEIFNRSLYSFIFVLIIAKELLLQDARGKAVVCVPPSSSSSSSLSTFHDKRRLMTLLVARDVLLATARTRNSWKRSEMTESSRRLQVDSVATARRRAAEREAAASRAFTTIDWLIDSFHPSSSLIRSKLWLLRGHCRFESSHGFFIPLSWHLASFTSLHSSLITSLGSITFFNPFCKCRRSKLETVSRTINFHEKNSFIPNPQGQIRIRSQVTEGSSVPESKLSTRRI